MGRIGEHSEVRIWQDKQYNTSHECWYLKDMAKLKHRVIPGHFIPLGRVWLYANVVSTLPYLASWKTNIFTYKPYFICENVVSLNTHSHVILISTVQYAICLLLSYINVWNNFKMQAVFVLLMHFLKIYIITYISNYSLNVLTSHNCDSSSISASDCKMIIGTPCQTLG